MESIIVRVGAHDRELARRTFALMAEVFGEAHGSLSDDYLDVLLGRPEFWAFAALCDGVVGGLTAHTNRMGVDDEDRHALDFYRALGGVASRVTFFEFGGP